MSCLPGLNDFSFSTYPALCVVETKILLFITIKGIINRDIHSLTLVLLYKKSAGAFF